MKVEEAAPKYERLMSPQEFLEWERKQERKHEYVEGFIITMQGASPKHNLVLSNVISCIGPFLRGKPCALYPSDLMTYVKNKESYFYPDASIICGENIDFGDHDDISQYPTVIFEILSPSTAEFDLGKKFFYYSQLPTIKEYIVIDPLQCFLRISRKTLKGTWKFEEYENIDEKVFIESIQFELSLKEVYDKIKFKDDSKKKD